MEIDMMRIDPGAIGFTSGFSQEHKYSKVGEQITIEQLTELSIVMRISRHDHVYRHHVRDNYFTCLAAPSVTRKGHRKIEPKAKHFSHCKKDQSSRPNQTNNLKRLAKITNHT